MKSFVIVFVALVCVQHAYAHPHPQEQVKTLKDLVCKLGRGMVNCDSVKIVDHGAFTEVNWKLNGGGDGMVTVKPGCKRVAPSIFAFLDAFGLADMDDNLGPLDPQVVKAKIIALFKNKALLRGVDSSICSFMNAKFVVPGTDQIIEYHCAGMDCLNFKATPEGTTWMTIKNQEMRIPAMDQVVGFMMDAKVKFDFRTARVPAGFTRQFHARPLPGKQDDQIVEYVNSVVPGYINMAVARLFLILSHGEKDPDHISLWDGYNDMRPVLPVTRTDSLRDIVCVMIGSDPVMCKSIEISQQPEQNLMEVKFGTVEKARFVMKRECERLIIDLYNAMAERENWIDSFHDLVSNREILRRLSSDNCAVFHSEFPTMNAHGKSRGLTTASCGDPRIPNKCVTHGVSPDGAATIRVENLFVSVPSLIKAQHFVKFKANSRVSFDINTMATPLGHGPTFEAVPLSDAVDLEERLAIDFYNQTGKTFIAKVLRDIGAMIRKGEKFPLFSELDLEIDRFMKVLEGNLQIFGIDFSKLFFDIASAIAGIPKCIVAAGHQRACPQECFQKLLDLRVEIEKDVGSSTHLLKLAHLYGYAVEESQKMCTTVMGWDWIGMPHPRPDFDIYDLVLLGSEAAKCARDLQHFLLFQGGNCFPGCKLTVESWGAIVSKYIHVSGGKIIQEFSKRVAYICKEAQGPCYPAVDGAAVECSVVQDDGVEVAGMCRNGECVAAGFVGL